jgi:parallel beta-helix repeat protein
MKKSSKIICKGILGVLIALFLTIPTGAVFINFHSIFSPNLSNSSIYRMGASIIVDDDGTGDYTSIQAAINNAFPGDVIIVKAGSYSDQLTINVANLTITAYVGDEPTISVSSYGVGIDVTAADVLLEGFEIYGNNSRTGGPYPTIRANTGADGLVVNRNSFRVYTGGIGQMALMIAPGVTNVSFTNNFLTNYATSLYHAARVVRTDMYYGSIQDAIDVAVSGDTIMVFSGMYDEQLAINKRVTLDGNGPGSVLQPTALPALGVYDVEIDVTSAVLKDFTFDFNGPTDTRSGNGIAVSDLSMPPVRNVKIQNNIIYTGDANTGIQTGKYSDVSGLLISGNMFYGDADGMGEGVYVNPYPGTGKVTIENNRFYGNLYAGISIEASNVTVFNNTINSSITKGVSGIRFIELTGGRVFSGVNISRNTITNMTYGIRIGTTTNVGSELRAEIQSNTINHNDNGIWVLYGANLSHGVHKNSLAYNTNYGINNIGSIRIDATNNWWGSMKGPYHPVANPSGTGVDVSDGVTFWPWYEFNAYSIRPYVQYLVGAPNAQGGFLIKDTTHIQIIARDNDSGLQSFKYRTWDALTRWSPWMEYTDGFTFSGDGLKIVQYNATDKAGTQNTGTRRHMLDMTPPTVTVLYPNGGEYLRGATTILWEAADKIPDQYQEDRISYYALPSYFPGHLQSFQPTVQNLDSIQLLLYGDDANVTVRVFSALTPVPIPIANSSQRLRNIGGNINAPVWIDFPFDTNVTLDTNITYYIGVSQKKFGPIGFYWYYYDSTGLSDPYTFGHAWLNGTGGLISHPEWDWAFRTMYWDEDLKITLEYSPTGVSPWSLIKDDEKNDGTYIWDTTRYPEGNNYRIRIIATDDIGNMAADISDNKFIIDNTGPYISNIVITDVTIERTDYTKDGDAVEITATIGGNPIAISADLSGLGKGTNVLPTSFTGAIAKWLVSSINCTPANGTVTVRVIATDPTGDESGNLGTIIADNAIPTIEIIRPVPGLYISDRMRHIQFSYPFVIGPITFRVEAQDSGSGIRTVEFYIQDILKSNDSTAPYAFFWDEAAFGSFIVKVVAYDFVGHMNSAILRDFFIINLNIGGR